MRYKVLLVDDELFDLEWLKQSLPWHDLGLELAGTSNSGFQALKRMENEPVDVLISDIRMPIMTGLELVERAKSLHPQLKTIFISGYDDFQYARKAISMSVTGYILKPVDLNELVGMLKDLVNQLDQERAQRERSHAWDQTLPMIRGAVLSEWLSGNTPVGKGSSILSSYGIVAVSPATVAIIEMDDLDWKLNRFPKQDHDDIIQETLKQVLEALAPYDLGYSFVYQRQITLFIHDFTRDRIGDLTRVIETIKAATPVTITIGLGEPGISPDALPLSYQQARHSLKHKMFLGKSRVIEPNDLKSQIVQGASSMEEKLEALFTSMLHYDLVGIDDHLQEAFHFVQDAETNVTVYNFTLHMISQLDKHFEKLGENLYDILSWDYRSLDVLFRFETVEDIQSWLRRRLFELSELMMLKMQKGNRKIVQDMQIYVDRHLADKMTLRILSGKLGFTPNYLGHLFKEETGESFNDYLNRKRMEKASELLTDPLKKIYEVSDEVGYKNIIYFNKQFKDYYGITPTEFRRKG